LLLEKAGWARLNFQMLKEKMRLYYIENFEKSAILWKNLAKVCNMATLLSFN
jgi:hypothetical protein